MPSCWITPPLTTSRCIVNSSRGGGQVVIAEHDARIADNMRRLVRNGEPITVVNCHIENKRAAGDTKQAFSRAYERGVVELKNQPKFNLVILDGCSNLPNDGTKHMHASYGTRAVNRCAYIIFVVF